VAENTYLGAHWCSRRQRDGLLSSSFSFVNVPRRRPFSGVLTLPFLNLAISEMQETSDWRAHGWNIMSEQRKSNWQHPNTYYWEREETPGTDERDTS
jgi:hypothetical protein